MAAPVFEETFESGVLDSRVTVLRIGGFAALPGVEAFTGLGSTRAFSFGRSSCGASCFDGFVTRFVIDLGAPTAITTLSFKELERFGNWGSGGAIFVDGVLFGTSHYDYGRLPYNDLIADSAFRTQVFDLNRTASVIELRVRDITSSSAIYMDDLVINGAGSGLPVTPIPEPSTVMLVALGLGAIWASRKASRR